MNELVVRFGLGGAAVSLFSAVAELFKPKTFAGIFSAAPAVVSLALAFAQHRHAAVTENAFGMICGGIAFFAYACACVFTTATRMAGSGPVLGGVVRDRGLCTAVDGAFVRPQIDIHGLSMPKAWEYGARFVFGGLIALLASLTSKALGDFAGGLAYRFPLFCRPR